MFDPKTPKYAAVDIITWLMLTDPHVLPLKLGTQVVNIMGRDEDQIVHCWKCLAIAAMTAAMHGKMSDALTDFKLAVTVVRRDTGSVPKWLTASVATAAAEAAKQRR